MKPTPRLSLGTFSWTTTLNGEFSLYVISKLDPGQVTGDPIVFKKYWSDGQKLNLMYEARDSSDDVLVGTRI